MIRHVGVQQKFAQKLDHTVIISKIGEILGDPLLLVGENHNQLAGYHMEMVHARKVIRIASWKLHMIFMFWPLWRF
ncbi:hypothetical protein [Paenibacillus polymyxa]|uniref:hypothetical protein n=1 Tax=Paenibacillus polymyxa TaxID=1406 RepID=UPI0004B5C9F2|nr:hypothetical protein [Paenibacillus polymyxa]